MSDAVNVTAASKADEFIGFDHNPAALLMETYRAIGEQSMQMLPFYHAEMPVHAELREFEGQWLGCVLTPWMLNVVILPGPQQLWPKRKVGERLALSLPRGDMTFTVGELEPLGQMLASSLMSPLDKHLNADQGIALVKDCLTMLFALPVAEVGQPKTVSRRELFTRYSGV